MQHLCLSSRRLHILVIPLKAFIFMVLTVVYLGAAHEDHH